MHARARTYGSAHLSGAVDGKHAQTTPPPPFLLPLLHLSSSKLVLVLMLFGHICEAVDARAALSFVFTRLPAGALQMHALTVSKIC